MNRIDRLTAILIHLQSKRVVTAQEIARRFNVSVRTVYRDIRSLEDAGIPIGSQAGSGYFIMEGYHLPPVMFSRDEAGALFLGGKLVERFSDVSVREHFDSALFKIKSVLGSCDKDHLETLGSHVEVMHGPPRDDPPPFLSRVRSILGNGVVVRAIYHSGYRDETTIREIEPCGLCFYGGHWHLIAYCRMRSDYRDFRVDRIKGLETTDTLFDPGSHGLLRDLIEKLVSSEALFPAVVRFPKSVASRIGEQKIYYGFVEERHEGDFVEMEFMTASHKWFARWILSFAGEARVVSPPELVNEVREQLGCLNRIYNEG